MHFFPYGNLKVRVRIGVRVMVRVWVMVMVRVRVMVSVRREYDSRTGRNGKRIREDIDSQYDFPYWKKLNIGTDSRTGRNAKRLREVKF